MAHTAGDQYAPERIGQFGILVTTSYVAEQAYQEIKEDRHPIVIICAADIVKLLIEHGVGTRAELDAWLKAF